MPDHRQKKRAKQKKKRAHSGRAGQKYALPQTLTALSAAEKRLMSKLPSLPVGPCFITRGWNVPSEPRLHCIIATRFLDDGVVIPAAILVDLGCEGVRDAYLAKPTPVAEGLEEMLGLMQQMFPRGFESISAPRASAIVKQAQAYAAELELEVPENARPVLGALSDELEPGFAVELGRRRKRLYSPRPGDDTRPMVKKMVQVLGPDGFEVVLPAKEEGGSTE